MRPFAPAALAGALALAVGPLFAEPLPTGDAAALGFSAEALQALDARIQQEVDAGEMPGAALMIVRDGQIAHLKTMGKLTPDGEAGPEDFKLFRQQLLAFGATGKAKLDGPDALATAYAKVFAYVRTGTFKALRKKTRGRPSWMRLRR